MNRKSYGPDDACRQILSEWDSFMIGWITDESFLFSHIALAMKLENSAVVFSFFLLFKFGLICTLVHF